MKGRLARGLALLAVAGFAGAAGAEPWIPLAKGNQWSYRTEDDVQYTFPDRPIVRNFWAGTSEEIVERAVAGQGGEPTRFVIAREVFRPGGVEAAPTNRRYVQTLSLGPGGLQLYGFQVPDAPPPLHQPVRYAVPLRLLPAELREGATWPVGDLVFGNAAATLQGRAVGREDVETPAGTFAKTWVVRFEGPVSGAVEVVGEWAQVSSGRLERTWWIAPGVGIVRERDEMVFRGVIEESTTVEGHATALRELLSHRSAAR